MLWKQNCNCIYVVCSHTSSCAWFSSHTHYTSIKVQMANLSIRRKWQHKTHNISGCCWCWCFFLAMVGDVWCFQDFCLSLTRSSVCVLFIVLQWLWPKAAHAFTIDCKRCTWTYLNMVQWLWIASHIHTISVHSVYRRNFMHLYMLCLYLYLGSVFFSPNAYFTFSFKFTFSFRMDSLAIVPQHCFRQHLHDQ